MPYGIRDWGISSKLNAISSRHGCDLCYFGVPKRDQPKPNTTMTPKEIKSFKRSEEYYEMSKLSWGSLSKLEEEISEKVYIVDNARMELMKQCETLRDECREESENGDDTKMLDYMSAVDNAIDTVSEDKALEEGSESYYSIILGSYEELSYESN